jgi:hypothetical protein
MEDALDRAITAVNLLETTVQLVAQTCAMVAQTGDRTELWRNADYVARCIARPKQTRALARDFLAVMANDARRRIGRDERLSHAQYVDALSLVAEFESSAAAHFPPALVAAA